MLALLLKKNRKEVRTEYRQRFVAVLLVVIFTVLLFSMVFLGSIWFLIKQVDLAYTYETKNLNNKNTEELAFKTKQLETEILKKFNALKKVNPAYYPIYDLINSEIDNLNKEGIENVKLSNIELNLVESDVEISLKGRAVNRETLLIFVGALKDQKVFEGVSLPISNLTKDVNIEFNLNFKTSLDFFNNYQIK